MKKRKRKTAAIHITKNCMLNPFSFASDTAIQPEDKEKSAQIISTHTGQQAFEKMKIDKFLSLSFMLNLVLLWKGESSV